MQKTKIPGCIMQNFEQHLGRVVSGLGRGDLHLLRTKLKHLDIDRNYYALVVIEGRDGSITQQELALLLNSDKVSIVRIIDYLSVKGYVQRKRKPDDRRKHSLSLTEKARKALPEIKQSFSDLNKIVLQGLNHAQVSDLYESIAKIENNLKDNNPSI